jgi:hypothetical protein
MQILNHGMAWRKGINSITICPAGFTEMVRKDRKRWRIRVRTKGRGLEGEIFDC